MEDIFEDAPDLRPVEKRQCVVSEGADPAGDRCLFLSLYVSLVKRANPNNKKEGAKESSKETGSAK